VADETEILAFIGNNFRSVWAIEVLSFLVHRAEAPSAEEIISELRVSSSVVSQSLAQLDAVALIMVGEDGRIVLQPGSGAMATLIQGAVDLYGRRPDLVRRTIVSRTSPSITAFADAFKLRKD
jgi:hypothetical protein